MYRAIARNKRSTVGIFAVFFVILGVLGFVANSLYAAPGTYSVFVLVLVGAALYATIQYFAAGRQAVAMSGAVPIQRSDEPRLYRIVENLSITTGTPMPAVYVVPDPAPNAFATGRDPAHAIVAATTGLLELMDDDELEGVMAHELSHVRNYDIRVSLAVYGLVVAVGLLSDLLIRAAFFGGRDRDRGGPIVLIVGIVAIVVAPIVASLVQLAISRQREYLADATGALTTRYPEGLARALAKLETNGGPLRRQNTSMAHLWITNPLRPGLLAGLFSTHPPIADRIARLRRIGGEF
ncbi:M48 family metalloprotease [uncultured Amnibacterium sp.]|uniref:M48 family metalloprotease n=1 Tax=uncultured Amnibacterium sp. TaxID=1631851 RepID=UPI0035CC5017